MIILIANSLWQPEKKNPGLTPMDWVKFLVSAIVGLVSFEYVYTIVVIKFLIFFYLVLLYVFIGCCCGLNWNAQGWFLGHFCCSLDRYWLLCKDIFHVKYPTLLDAYFIFIINFCKPTFSSLDVWLTISWEVPGR